MTKNEYKRGRNAVFLRSGRLANRELPVLLLGKKELQVGNAIFEQPAEYVY